MPDFERRRWIVRSSVPVLFADVRQLTEDETPDHTNNMNQTALRTTTLAAILALATTVTFAQNNQRQNQTQQRPNNQATAETRKENLKVSPEELHKEVTDAHKASKIIGTAVRNRQNEKLGTVKDVVLDVRTGKIAYAVLSVGGFLGAGDKLIALPLDTLTPQPGGEYFVIDASKERLEQSAGFNDNDWPTLDAVNANTVGYRADPSRQDDNKSNQPTPRANNASTPRNNAPRQP
jgi:sporulation protein YlmC with PRC-barrel domain